MVSYTRKIDRPHRLPSTIAHSLKHQQKQSHTQNKMYCKQWPVHVWKKNILSKWTLHFETDNILKSRLIKILISEGDLTLRDNVLYVKECQCNYRFLFNKNINLRVRIIVNIIQNNKPLAEFIRLSPQAFPLQPLSTSLGALSLFVLCLSLREKLLFGKFFKLHLEIRLNPPLISFNCSTLSCKLVLHVNGLDRCWYFSRVSSDCVVSSVSAWNKSSTSNSLLTESFSHRGNPPGFKPNPRPKSTEQREEESSDENDLRPPLSSLSWFSIEDMKTTMKWIIPTPNEREWNTYWLVIKFTIFFALVFSCALKPRRST